MKGGAPDGSPSILGGLRFQAQPAILSRHDPDGGQQHGQGLPFPVLEEGEFLLGEVSLTKTIEQ